MDMTGARRKALREIIDTDREMIRIYSEAAEALRAEAEQAKDGSLTQRWKLEMQRSVRGRLHTISNTVYSRIKQGSSTAARLPATEHADWIDKVFARAGQKTVDTSFRTTLARTSDEALQQIISGRAYLDGKSLSKRIWTQVGRQEQGIQHLLEQAVAKKQSAKALAKELHAYLSPEVKDTPDASYYARRMARTSINHAYALAGREAAARNPFATAMHWALSPQHFERQVLPFGADICDEYATHDEGLGVGNWPVRATPLPHANCLCNQYPVVPQSLDDCAKELRAWLDGADNPKLEESFGGWKAEINLQNMGINATMRVDDDTASKRLRMLERIAGKADVQAMSLTDRQRYFDSLTDASEDRLRELAGIRRHRDTVTMSDLQFGDKTGKHAAEWGLNPANAEDRQQMRAIIGNIVDRYDEMRLVDFSGQQGVTVAYIKGSDVVLYKQDGRLITIMKDGAQNKRVQRGEKTDGWIW